VCVCVFFSYFDCLFLVKWCLLLVVDGELVFRTLASHVCSSMLVTEQLFCF
jgi:hypothetical protein